MKYAYIFDYSTGSIYGVKLSGKLKDLDSDELIAELNLRISDCYVMFTTEKKVIEYLNL